ncbi:Protein CBG25595 [Caenorhabditis briggsae]|uniref:Protein CBG25595 n=1 Tax=Caenorhabditis briggsae TaxID=6238 RepID=B6IF80_CAEBR|nr:Protein CBG25595 [Caenorhabditis briggsae]CAR98560.1 Protein CBG25595 [Caenorhabditis briggsae]
MKDIKNVSTEGKLLILCRLLPFLSYTFRSLRSSTHHLNVHKLLMRKQINKSTTHLDTFLFFFCWVDANVGRLLRWVRRPTKSHQ